MIKANDNGINFIEVIGIDFDEVMKIFFSVDEILSHSKSMGEAVSKIVKICNDIEDDATKAAYFFSLGTIVGREVEAYQLQKDLMDAMDGYVESMPEKKEILN